MRFSLRSLRALAANGIVLGKSRYWRIAGEHHPGGINPPVVGKEGEKVPGE
jgi:hypothetical protein